MSETDQQRKLDADSSGSDVRPHPSVGGAGRVATPSGESGAALGSPLPARTRRPIPPKLYRIGEVVGYSGVSRQTIHNYTTMGLLKEHCWTEGGHRLYDESAFERLDEIAELKAQHKSLRDIREHFALLDKQQRA